MPNKNIIIPKKDIVAQLLPSFSTHHKSSKQPTKKEISMARNTKPEENKAKKRFPFIKKGKNAGKRKKDKKE
ncbi:MAG: hypothetical protein MI922_16445 [Bacteroidales bacterium]|nr:hypothetical protein [Bacteroidales bacterium]